MTAGLTLFNSWGSVQIDQSWRNYGFRQKIPVTISAYGTSPPNPPGLNGNTYQLVVSGSPALLVACRASVLLPVKLHSYFLDGVWTFNWLFMPPTPATYTETVEFYVFDGMDGVYSNVGLEVWIDGGPRAFHSDAPVMKVAPGQPCDVAFTGAPGHSYVPLITRNPIYSVFLGLPTGWRFAAHGLYVSGSNILTQPTGPLGAYGTSGPVGGAGAFIPVDVTGLS